MTPHRGFHKWPLLVGVFLLFFAGVSASGRTLFVSPDGSGEGGVSWTTAFRTVTDCVGAANVGDFLWIRNGTYTESVRIDRQITIIGGFDGTETELFPVGKAETTKTIMSPVGMEAPAFVCAESCKIEKIVVTGSNGAGITAYQNASPKFENCYITGNTSGSVGGGFAITNASPEIIDCTITSNSAKDGGGIYIHGSSNVLLRNCTITGNSATNDGAWGGGILFGGSTLVMENCRIEANYGNLGESSALGGGLLASFGNVLLTNCLFRGNIADRGYGGQFFSFSCNSFMAQNCTIIGDEKAVSWRTDPPSIVNSVLWGSSGMCVPEFDSTGNPDISYSCIQGGYAGEGNISDDPLFRNAAAGDFRLLPESPCIDTAGTSGPSDDLSGKPRPVDIAGIGREVTDTYDMGAYEFQLDELPTPTPTQVPSQIDPRHTRFYQ